MKRLTHNLLSMVLFSCARGGTKIDPEYTIKRILWVIGKVEDAICVPRSQERIQLESLGFAALTLIGPHGTESVIPFDKGNRLRVSDDGRSIVEDGIMGFENLTEMLGMLFELYHYARWVEGVHDARDCGERPPVFDTATFANVDGRLQSWLGTEAEAYLVYWNETRHATAAMRAATSVEQPSNVADAMFELDDSPT